MKSNNETGGAHCFVCSGGVSTAGVQLSASMPHSHAPLLVLLADVLGYSLANQQSLHSKVSDFDNFKMKLLAISVFSLLSFCILYVYSYIAIYNAP